VLAALGALTLGSAVDAAAEVQGQEWIARSTTSAKGNGAAIVGGDRFRLVNNIIDRALVYGSRKYGINLVWGAISNPGSDAYFVTEGSGEEVVRYGDNVALAITENPTRPARPFLKYKSRDYGINLDWTTAKVYEWKVSGAGRAGKGSPVRYGDKFLLFNARSSSKGGFLYYNERKYGINLSWRGTLGCPNGDC